MIKLIAVVAIIGLIAIFFYRANGSNADAEKNNKIGAEFLAKNRDQDGVMETGSGLQHLVLTSGEGTTHPGAADKVKVHYHGTLIDGTVFDSSVERGQPISFGLNQVIAGWTEGLQLMVVGDKTRFFIPPNLGYGNKSTGKIPSGSVLIFDVELLAINQ
jgi:peptidylprolyl isomerase